MVTAGSLSAQEWLRPSEIVAGQALIYGGSLSAAHLYFTRLTEGHPRDPAGPTLAASALIWWGEERGDDGFLADSIDALLVEGVRRAEAALAEAASDSARASLAFWLGSAHGFRARQAELLGRPWRAAREAARMRGALQFALALDSTCVDCRLGLAAYEYGLARASALARLVARIAGLGGGDVERALAECRLVAERGTYTRVDAQWFYANALFRESSRDPALREEALRVIGLLADEHPGNPVFDRFRHGPPAEP